MEAHVDESSNIRLVVIGGEDAGAQLDVDDSIKTVGRARDADLSLTDASISRYHFHVRASEGGVRVQVCEGAAQLVSDNRKISTGDVKIGELLLVGRTLLRITEVCQTAPEPVAERDALATTVRSLLTGTGLDVVGLAVVFTLNGALMRATDAAEVEAVVLSWAKEHASCELIDFRATGGAHGESLDEMPVIEKMTPAGMAMMAVPAPGAPTGWISFALQLRPTRVADPLRRLLVLAAALTGARLAYLSALQVVKQDRDALRLRALGSSRAFLGTSSAAQALIATIPRLAAADVTALLIGETGVGKTFVARLIHESGPRKEQPFRVINCAAIPESIIESELFGHVRGAFTGATEQAGVFEASGEGTVLLDEIGELPLGSQAKLLRVLEERQFERLGSTRSIQLRARVLVATNRDLDVMVAAGTFRRDLFFRIAVVRTLIPPLRERGDDVLTLAKKMLADLVSTTARRVLDFSPEALEAIRNYSWPGNVRELRNVIEHALVMGDGPVIDVSDMPAGMRVSPAMSDSIPTGRELVEIPMREDLLQAKNQAAALAVTGGNKKRAAALLGIGRTTFYSAGRRGGEDGK